jgi:hypothetical protein
MSEEENEEHMMYTLMEFSDIHKMIQENNNHIKELKKKNMELNKLLEGKKENILHFMDTNESDIFESDYGEFVKKESVRKKSLNVKNVLEIVKKYVDVEILKKIELEMKNRPKEIKKNLVFKSNHDNDE